MFHVKICIRTWDSISDHRWSNSLALLLWSTAKQPIFFPTCRFCMHGLSKGQEWRWIQTVRPPKSWTVSFSLVRHSTRMSRRALCALQNWFWEEKKTAVLQSTVVPNLKYLELLFILLSWQTSYWTTLKSATYLFASFVCQLVVVQLEQV